MSTAPTALSGLQKAAIVLVAVGPADSAKVLQHFSEDEAGHLARTVANLDRVPADEVQSVLEEFAQDAASHEFYVKGGIDYAEQMLTDAYGHSVAERLIQKLHKSFAKDGFDFDQMIKAEPQQLAKLIQDEHPQTIALILAHLDPSQAATLLSCLPAETRIDVAGRIADLDQISPEIVRHIASTINGKLRNLGELSREACGGVKSVANIMNRLSPEACTQLLDHIGESKPALFESIRRFMFVFRDFESLDSKSLSLLFSRVPRSSMIVALKGANESLRNKFIQTQSQRGATALTEELAELGPVKLRDVDSAQQEVISLAREMEKEGLISLKASEEKYIE